MMVSLNRLVCENNKSTSYWVNKMSLNIVIKTSSKLKIIEKSLKLFSIVLTKASIMNISLVFDSSISPTLIIVNPKYPNHYFVFSHKFYLIQYLLLHVELHSNLQSGCPTTTEIFL